MIARLAPSRATVLIVGEAGTGKSRVACALHGASPRAGGPFVTVDCSAITDETAPRILFGGPAHASARRRDEPTGAIHAADRGTLHLLEIASLPLVVQPRLLRFLDDGEAAEAEDPSRHLDVRVVASTSRDLRARVRAHLFRADLADRVELVVVHLDLP